MCHVRTRSGKIRRGDSCMRGHSPGLIAAVVCGAAYLIYTLLQDDRATTPILPTTTVVEPGTQEEIQIEVFGPGDLGREKIALTNAGVAPIKIQFWSVQRNEDPFLFLFPDVSLEAGETIYLHTRVGTNTAADFFHEGAGARLAPRERAEIA